jgi:chemosensory pili system protein ChpC
MNATVEAPREIRGLLITVTGGRVLLPNANVSEIITAATPEPVENAPKWMLGRVRWRGWRVPLFSFSLLTGVANRDGALNAKVTVLKALGGNPKMPFVAMLCLGFPRLTTVTPEILIPTDEGGEHAPGILSRVLVRDDQAYVPDLFTIERMIADALEPPVSAPVA